MRSMFIVTLVLLLAAFAVAQDATSHSAPASPSQNQTQSPSQPSSPAQAPSADSPSKALPMGGDTIEGCLGGTAPNYTVTDKAGTTYSLEIPPTADASVLAKHLGESVQVQGSLAKSGASDASAAAPDSSSSSAAGSAASGGKSIKVARIGRGTTSCPAASSKAPQK